MKPTKKVIVFLISVLISIGLMEILLRVFDPMGVVEYSKSFYWINDNYIEHETGYTFNPGEYMSPYGKVTVMPDGTRWTGSDESGCKIAIIGDSVAFGMGVPDEATFVYILAKMFPGVQFINTAKPGYNIENIIESVEYYPADGYVYYMIGNDHGLAQRDWHVKNDYYATTLYIRSSRANYEEKTNILMYNEYVNRLKDLGVFFISEHANPLIDQIDIDVIEVPFRPDSISYIDPHPSIHGHREIANFIFEEVQGFLSDTCGI